jgi:multicomponent Na+:H+ antiporter subunit E
MMKTATNLSLQFINLWLTLFIIWLVANGSLATHTIVTGITLSALIALAFATFSRVYSVVRWSPTVIAYYLMYLAVFLYELIKANLNVVRLVYTRRLNIKPAIVEIKTELKSPMGRLALANTITLTPGTLVVDIKDDSLFIHWINISTTDPEEAARAISGRFEKYLKVIYG